VVSARDAAALAVGIVVGTGIFAVPGFVARELGGPGPVLLAWVLGGAITLAAALTYAELAAMFPRQGGSFVYVREAFGPFAAFLLGWGPFLVAFPASAAGIATILGIYGAEALGIGPGAIRPLAFAGLLLVWGLNRAGTRFSVSLQSVLTATKIGALGILALLALFAGPGRWERLLAGVGAAGEAGGVGWPGPAAFATALVGIFWTFDGWANLVILGGEIGDPRRTIVRALLLGVGTVTGVYLLLNVAYLVLLPFDELAGSASAASAAAEVGLGPAGRRILAGLVVLSSFGALFGIAIAAPRYFWAMGRSGLFFAWAGRIDERTSAPRAGGTALLVLSAAYVATGTFEQIMAYYVAMTALYTVLTPAAVFRLRRTRPDAERPFRVPGYPVTPAIAIAAALWVTGYAMLRDPIRAAVGVALMAAAWPSWHLWRRSAPRG
jgi:APA family basic amino acid/polyamine antiporter